MAYNGILLYIDPGTGSMLFTILIGLVGTAMFLAKKLWLKLKFRLSGGKATISEEDVPYVIFSDSKNYWNTFKPICDEFERRGIDVVYWTASPDDPALNEEYEHVNCEFIGEGNKAFAKLNMMRADICLSTTPGLDVYQWKRSRNVKYYVHIMHSAATTLLYRMFGMDYYDALLLTGDFQMKEVRELEEVRKDPQKETEVVGCVYLDALKNKLDEAGQIQRTTDKKTILLAPSWGDAAILKLYGNRLIDALIKTGYRIIIRPHPQSIKSEKDMIEKLMKEYPETEDLEWNNDTDNFAVLRKADLMITDFSAVILDFALVFDKPVIYAEYDLDKSVYDAAWIDHPLWQEEMFPKLGTALKEEQFDDLKSIIDSMISSETFASGREIAREEAWMNIGHSAELTVDYLVRKSAQLHSTS
jgi:hypothetical protein